MGRPAPIFASEKTAAALLDMKPVEFRSLVERGVLPQPHDIHGFTRWRVSEIEAIGNGSAMDSEEFEV